MRNIGHGGKEIVERVLPPIEAKERIRGLKQIEVTDRVARECIDLAYGFFTPLQGFMGKADVGSVCEKMTLTDGTLWPIPIVFDIAEEDIKQKEIKEKDTILLAYNGHILAILEIEEIFKYDKLKIEQVVLGTTDLEHPGVKMYNELKDTFIGGKITMINIPKFNPPFDKFWYPPLQLREKFANKGWERIVAHQTRNVPHTGHEWLMKGAWFSTNGDLPVEKLTTGILVSCIIGPKRIGDYIDEAIILGHQKLYDAKYFRDSIHIVSFVLWDMRYAGPKEAILHAIIRTNLGCTHHMFGRDHAGVGSYYDPYDAHRIFDQIPKGSLNIKPVRILEWWYCPICGEVTYSGLCGHTKERQPFSGTMIRSMIQDKVKPTKLIMRPEVFDSVMENADKYGFGSPFCTEEYLAKRQPVFELS
ncbi:Sulfate adenylyltransferase [subsurface metagenome]|nr:sulfate adenylyltransferase [Clostridia bacterium]RXG62486.1 MAG: sulfate adenylyltransferase [Candidatus Atribacteria bacterium 1244-E10-H5-B2]